MDQGGYGSWAIKDLKDALKKRNAKFTGTKNALVRRLQDYDILYGPLVNYPERVIYKLEIPDPKQLRDIHSDSLMPKLEIEDVQHYCSILDLEMQDAENMYKEDYLLVARVTFQDDFFYVTGICASEVHKNFSFYITTKMQHHLVLETQCECAEGMPPNAQCKHVLVLLLGVLEFTKSKTIQIQSTCTPQHRLHQPSPEYDEEPVLAENLILSENMSKFKDIVTYDPIPTAKMPSKEKYNEWFRSIVLNYSCTFKDSQMPILQLYKPANENAISLDHNYLGEASGDKQKNS